MDTAAAAADLLSDAALDLVSAANTVSVAVTALVAELMPAGAPAAALHALAALDELGDAQGRVLAAVGQLDG